MTLLLSEKKQADNDTQYAGLRQHLEENNATFSIWDVTEQKGLAGNSQQVTLITAGEGGALVVPVSRVMSCVNSVRQEGITSHSSNDA